MMKIKLTKQQQEKLTLGIQAAMTVLLFLLSAKTASHSDEKKGRKKK